MIFLNTRTVRLYTDMTVSEVTQQLTTVVQDPTVFGKVEKEYYGIITACEFKITRTQGANRSSFYPVITGKITSENDQRLITLSFRVHKLFRVLIWFPVICCILNLINIAYNTISGADSKNAGWDLFMGFALGYVVFILVLLLLPWLFGFFSSISDTVAQFKRIWNAEEH